jgi:fumarate reductase flavoprotein subunit
MKMELPPGYRGYGNDNNIVHPDTEKRTQEINKITAELGDAPDRHALQQALMPYTLPSHLQPANERLSDTLAVIPSQPVGNKSL